MRSEIRWKKKRQISTQRRFRETIDARYLFPVEKKGTNRGIINARGAQALEWERVGQSTLLLRRNPQV